MNTEFTTKSAAEYLRLSPSTLKRMRAEKRGPNFEISKDGLIIYKKRELNAFMDRNLITTLDY